MIISVVLLITSPCCPDAFSFPIPPHPYIAAVALGPFISRSSCPFISSIALAPFISGSTVSAHTFLLPILASKLTPFRLRPVALTFDASHFPLLISRYSFPVAHLPLLISHCVALTPSFHPTVPRVPPCVFISLPVTAGDWNCVLRRTQRAYSLGHIDVPFFRLAPRKPGGTVKECT